MQLLARLMLFVSWASWRHELLSLEAQLDDVPAWGLALMQVTPFSGVRLAADSRCCLADGLRALSALHIRSYLCACCRWHDGALFSAGYGLGDGETNVYLFLRRCACVVSISFLRSSLIPLLILILLNLFTLGFLLLGCLCCLTRHLSAVTEAVRGSYSPRRWANKVCGSRLISGRSQSISSSKCREHQSAVQVRLCSPLAACLSVTML